MYPEHSLARLLVWASILGALLVGAVVGCGSSETTSDQIQRDLAPRLDGRGARSLLDMIEYEAAAFDDVAKCMREQGFEYKPFGYTYELERLPVLISGSAADPAAFAELYGYGETDPDWASSADHDPANFSPIDPDYDRALYGDVDLTSGRPEGCWGNRILPIVEAAETFELARQDLNAQLDQHPDFEAVRQSWERCMAQRGYRYSSPAEAVEYFRSEFNRIRFSGAPGQPETRPLLEELLADEIRTAVADQTGCDGIEVRSLRLDLAQELGVPGDAVDALAVLASDDAQE